MSDVLGQKRKVSQAFNSVFQVIDERSESLGYYQSKLNDR
jgi:hypothetical protein